MLSAITFAGMIALMAWSALACYSLRDFTYSRLESLCALAKRPERFSEILRKQESALLAVELLLTAGTVGSTIAFGIWLAEHPEWRQTAVSVGLAWLGFAAAMVIGADVLPWTIARVASEPFLFYCWPGIRLLQLLFGPLLRVSRWMDRAAHRLVGRGEPEADDAAVINEEIRTVVDEGQRDGYLESGARTMIHRVMELQDEDVRAIMTPRTAMFCIDVESTLDEARIQLLDSGHSRVPVIGDSPDDILGILLAKDLLRALAAPDSPSRSGVLAIGRSTAEPPSNRSPLVLRDLLREPFYVPETTGIPSLLETMQREHVQIAIVLDEYGGVSGLVTMEDILEEIVGEIADEFDDEDDTRPLIQTLGPLTAEVDALVHIDDLNKQFDFGLPEDGEFDTIGGLIFGQLGRIPEVGESIRVGRALIRVLSADKRRLQRLRMESADAAAAASSGNGSAHNTETTGGTSLPAESAGNS